MNSPAIGVIMGSRSDWETMQEACDVLDELAVAYEQKIVSAHRTPDWLAEYAKTAHPRGLQVIIAGAGGAAEGQRLWGRRPEDASGGGALWSSELCTHPPTPNFS